MSKTLQQIFALNPITTNLSTDLMYFVQSPYTPGTDAGMTFANFSAQFGFSGGVINPAHGGTGVNNGTNTLTLGGNTAFSGAFAFTGTLTGATTVTFPTSGTLATTSQIATGAPLTEVNDTNVTLTLGGSPSTALVNAASITAGWAGQLSPARGGTGVNNGTSTMTIGGNFSMSGAFPFVGTVTGSTAVTFPTSGTLATTSSIPTGAALTETNDTNVTLTLGGSPATALVNAASITAGWSGQLSPARGGTGVNNGSSTITLGGNFAMSGAFGFTGTVTATTAVTFPTSGTLATTAQIFTSPLTTKGDLLGFSTVNARVPVGGTDGQILQVASANAAGLGYSTTTYPTTNAINTLLYASSANVMAALATANSAILVTDSGGVPSLSTTIPAHTTSSITFSPSTGGIVGTTAADNAAAGKVGEYVTSNIAQASATSLTNNTAKNVTSISLTAGDWDIYGNVSFIGLAVTTPVYICWTSTTSATLPDGSQYSRFNETVVASNIFEAIPTPYLRVNVNTTTTVYLSAFGLFSAGTLTACGSIFARRVR